ncbi:MAG: hypothetical protein U0441_33995 [Polyangiaceae bacterium]
MKSLSNLQNTLFVTVPAVLALLLTAGCSGGGGSSGGGAQGCSKDTDCKGDRVCAAGQCVEQPSKDPASIKPGGNNNQGPNIQQPQNPTPPANIGPGGGTAYANDGLPAEIPPPGSQPPTVQEWNAVPREVTVRGSSKLNCETKMLREWLRASCHTSAAVGTPFMIDMSPPSGVQAFKFVGSGVASVVVQVVRGREFSANFIWDNGGAHQGAELFVKWPSDNPRPQMYFQSDQ